MDNKVKKEGNDKISCLQDRKMKKRNGRRTQGVYFVEKVSSRSQSLPGGDPTDAYFVTNFQNSYTNTEGKS